MTREWVSINNLENIKYLYGNDIKSKTTIAQIKLL